MKLIKCYVENFGTLSHFEMDFSDGIQMFYKENGWGKSTLAAFLKVMFFGFDNGKKRSSGKREREKYKPWQGGTYGGSLVFEVAGKVYRMERSFGEREREDNFLLFDEGTGMPTVEYTKDIGKEIFGIDEESFGRTMYVSQAELETKATDSIHAKIGNLTDTMYDLDNYSQAQQKLQQEGNRLTPKRKTGLLSKLSEEIDNYKQQILDGEYLRREQEGLIAGRKELESQKKYLLEEQKYIQEKILENGKQKEQQSLRVIYQELCQQKREKEIQVEELEDYFGNGIPEMDEVTKTIEQIELERVSRGTLEHCSLTAEEEEILDQVENKWEDIPELGQIEKYLKEYEATKNKKKKPVIEADPEEIVEKAMSIPAFIGIGMGLAVIGIFIAIKSLLVGMCFIAVGSGMVFVGRKQQQSAREERELEMEQEQNKLEENTALTRFLETHPVLGAEGVKDHLTRLQIILVQLQNLRGRKEAREKHTNLLAVTEENISQFYRKYNLPEAESRMLQLQSMLGMLEKYHSVAADFYKAAGKKEQFERENDMAKLLGSSSEEKSLEELQDTLNQNLAKQEEIQKKNFEWNKQVEAIQTQLEDVKRLEAELVAMEEQREMMQHKYEMICKAQQYLQEAKNQFTARYRNPLAESFKKYTGKLLQQQEDFQVDAELNVRKREYGFYRESNALSDGWKDLISFCLRLSMVDAMYQKEKPFLILDDPFVNLDDEKMQGALKLLDYVQQDYQLLYFTCHESRKILQ